MSLSGSSRDPEAVRIICPELKEDSAAAPEKIFAKGVPDRKRDVWAPWIAGGSGGYRQAFRGVIACDQVEK